MAATYYVRADGNAANSAAAIGPTSDASACMNISVFHASSFSPNDTIYFSDNGGDYNSSLTIPSSGLAESIITYSAALNESPKIVNTTSNSININNKSYIKIDGFIIDNKSTTNYTKVVNLGGIIDNLEISNINATMDAISATRYLISASGNISNLTINEFIGSGQSNYSMYFYGAINSDLIIRNTTITGGNSIRILNTEHITIENVTHNNSTGAVINISACSGQLKIDNFNAVNPVGAGISIGNTTFNNGSYIKNSTTTSSGSHGISISACSGQLEIDNFNAVNPGGIGIHIANTTFNNGSYIKNSTTTSSGSHGISISACSGQLEIDNFNAVNPGGIGIHIANTTFNNGSYIKNSTITSSGSYGCYCSSVSDILLQNNIISNSGSGGYVISDSDNIDFLSNTANDSTGGGFWVMGTSNDVSLIECNSYDNSGDGFGTNEAAHDIMFDRCTAYNNGNKTNLYDGDGFTTHMTNYNITIKSCLAYNNTVSGFAMVGTSHGTIVDSVFWHNGGDWSQEGGGKVDQVRAGAYISSGINPTTSGSWTVKNNIIEGNYPREIFLTEGSVDIVDFNNNQYYHIGDGITENIFATVDTGINNITWETYSASYELNSNYGNPLFIDAINSDFTLQSTSPAIDSGTNVNLTTDFLGNPIYGTPDIGAYEYQPPYTIGTNEIDIAGNIRIYADGKFRNTATAIGTTADLSITPVGGFGAGDYSEWMDIEIDSWLTSGTYNKQWTATSTTATSTTYTIGDLKANTYYAFKLDGTASTTAITNDSVCTDGVCKSDAGGQIIFTYVGGYSTHTFGLEEDETAPASFSLSSPATNSWASTTLPTLSWNASSDAESGLAKYQLWIDDSLDTDNIATTTTSITPTDALPDGDHTWKIVAFDNAGNSATSTETWTIRIDTTEPARTNGSPGSALSAGTTQTTLSLTTNETATCKYSTTANTAYSSMTAFSNTDNTTHSTPITGLTNGTSYNYYIKCQDAVGNVNSSDYAISFSVSSAGGGMPFWMLNQINQNQNQGENDAEENNNGDEAIDSRLRGNDNKKNLFAYSQPRLKSLPQEQNSAKELKQKLEEFYSKGKIPVHKKHWHTIVNSYIYGNYPITAIIKAIKFGGKTVHPIIPFSAWQKAKDYLEWIGR